MTRLRLVKRMKVDEPETDFILSLAKSGMSYACIAKEVYGKVSEYHVKRISYILSYEAVKVTDYRNGRNSTGRTMIAAIRRGTNVLSVLQAEVKKNAAAIRKTG